MTISNLNPHRFPDLALVHLAAMIVDLDDSFLY